MSLLLFVLMHRSGQKGGGEGGGGQVSAPLHTGSQAAPREETLHRGLLLDPGRKRLTDSDRLKRSGLRAETCV